MDQIFVAGLLEFDADFAVKWFLDDEFGDACVDGESDALVGESLAIEMIPVVVAAAEVVKR